MCRCIVRNHLFAHAGNGVPKSRPTRKTAANRQKGGETVETNASEVQTGDEQVYKKDLDELIDYINTPMNQEGKDSKRNKKKKMKKRLTRLAMSAEPWSNLKTRLLPLTRAAASSRQRQTLVAPPLIQPRTFDSLAPRPLSQSSQRALAPASSRMSSLNPLCANSSADSRSAATKP